MPETVFNVQMSCEGCAGAVRRVLGKIDGVDNINADVPSQKVTVTGSASAESMLEALQKWASASNKAVSLA